MGYVAKGSNGRLRCLGRQRERAVPRQPERHDPARHPGERRGARAITAQVQARWVELGLTDADFSGCENAGLLRTDDKQ